MRRVRPQKLATPCRADLDRLQHFVAFNKANGSGKQQARVMFKDETPVVAPLGFSCTTNRDWTLVHTAADADEHYGVALAVGNIDLPEEEPLSTDNPALATFHANKPPVVALTYRRYDPTANKSSMRVNVSANPAFTWGWGASERLSSGDWTQSQDWGVQQGLGSARVPSGGYSPTQDFFPFFASWPEPNSNGTYGLATGFYLESTTAHRTPQRGERFPAPRDRELANVVCRRQLPRDPRR